MGGGERLHGHRGGGAEEVREIHAPRRVHGEDAEETRDEGRQAGDLRESGDGEGEAREDGGEGVSRRGDQEALQVSLAWGVGREALEVRAACPPLSWGFPRRGDIYLSG